MWDDWQFWVVAAAVLWAGMVVLRRALLLVSPRRTGCGTGACGGCGTSQRAAGPLVTLGGLAPPDEHHPRT